MSSSALRVACHVCSNNRTQPLFLLLLPRDHRPVAVQLPLLPGSDSFRLCAAFLIHVSHPYRPGGEAGQQLRRSPRPRGSERLGLDSPPEEDEEDGERNVCLRSV